MEDEAFVAAGMRGGWEEKGGEKLGRGGGGRGGQKGGTDGGKGEWKSKL